MSVYSEHLKIVCYHCAFCYKMGLSIEKGSISIMISHLIGGSRGGAPGTRPPFAWHPSSLADLGGARPVRAPPICLAS